MKRRLLTFAAVFVAAMMASTGSAFAHECFIANRSAQGNANATHSTNWFESSVVEFANSPDFPPGVDAECFIAFWTANGGPESFTVRSDKTIGEGSSNPNLGNGKGLDHIEDAYGALLGAALGACEV